MKKGRFTVVVLSISFFSFLPGLIRAEERMIIGAVEEVMLMPWGVKLPARIDTGAARTSLDARELEIDGNMAVFKLPKEHGGMLLRLPIVEWRDVRFSKGVEKRPVVEIHLCIGSEKLRVKANLNDRSMVKYPIILGRNSLRKHFVVDAKRSRVTEPVCSDRLDLKK